MPMLTAGPSKEHTHTSAFSWLPTLLRHDTSTCHKRPAPLGTDVPFCPENRAPNRNTATSGQPHPQLHSIKVKTKEKTEVQRIGRVLAQPSFLS